MTERAARSWVRFLRDRLEFRLLAAIVAAGGAILVFLQLSDEVGENETATLDRTVLLWFRDPSNPADPIGSHGVEEAMRDVTALGGFTFLTLATVVATASLVFFRKPRQAVVFAATVVLAEISSDVLKLFFERARPALVPPRRLRLFAQLPERPFDPVGGDLPDPGGDPLQPGSPAQL